MEQPEVRHILCPGGFEEEEGSYKGSSEKDELDDTSPNLGVFRLRRICL